MKTTTTSTNETVKQPVVVKRPADERGLTEFEWLYSRHSFSFGEYYDPAHMGFHSLRVINDDIISTGGGFGTHPHRDAEIFSYVVDGALEHRDSMGNGSIINAGDLQYMSAGSGVRHSEFNPLPDRPTHLLQIWLKPNVSGGEPRYAEKHLKGKAQDNALTLLFSGEAKTEVIQIRQDAEIYFGRLEEGRTLDVPTTTDRHVYIHVIRGEITAAGETLSEGDAVAISYLEAVKVTAKADAEFLVFVLN